MGLNRFYTYNGKPIRTAEGAPIGYEKTLPPTDYFSLWNFETNLEQNNPLGSTFYKAFDVNDSYEAGIKGNCARITGNGGHDATLLTQAKYPMFETNYTIIGWFKHIEIYSILSFFETRNSKDGDFIYAVDANKLAIGRQGDTDIIVSTREFTFMNQWNLIALTGNTTSLSGWVNGESILTLNKAIPTYTLNELYLPMKGSSSFEAGFKTCLIDELRVYDYELSSDQIMAIYEDEYHDELFNF